MAMTIKGSGVTLISPSAAVTTFTNATITFPNGVSGFPIMLRASGSVSGVIQLNFSAGNSIQIPVNPNVSFTSATIPEGAYPSPVTQVTVQYISAGAGSIFVFVDFA
jgi:hypothetical protein